MASITNPKEQGIWHELKELDFLNWFFSWFFLLLTQLSEPLMLLSTLYVIAETGVHAIASPGLHALAVGIMITAPEILLPGAFVKAAKTRDQGGRFSVLLYVMCWTFVGLTLLTLADLFIWHLSGTSLACLMYARCAAAVGYSILMRVMSHGHGQVLQVAVPDVLANMSELSEAVSEHAANTEQALTESEFRIGEHLERTLSESEQRLSERFYRTLVELSQAVNERIERTSSELSERIDRTPDELLSLPAISELTALPSVFERQLRIVVQEVRTSLVANTETKRLSLPKTTLPNIPAVRANTETNEIGKGDFVRLCLSEHPEMRNSDIQRTASEQGITLSAGYISDIRKAFGSEQVGDTAQSPVVLP